MKKISSILSILLYFTITSNVNASIINGDFESGNLNPWYQGNDINGTENWNITNTDAHTGMYSATNLGNKEIRQDFLAVTTSSVLELSFWAKHVGQGTAMFVNFFYNDSTSFGITIFIDEADDWSFFDVTASLDLSKSLNGFSVYGNTVGCNADCTRTYLDDVVLDVAQQVPSPSTIALISLALIGLRWTKR